MSSYNEEDIRSLICSVSNVNSVYSVINVTNMTLTALTAIKNQHDFPIEAPVYSPELKMFTP